MLTFFSGFGLGTLLLPAFAAFFPLPLAIAMTGVVHFVSNLGKLALMARHAAWSVALRFGAASVVGALAGAWVLGWLGDAAPLTQWNLAVVAGWPTLSGTVTAMKLVVGAVIVAFGIVELLPPVRAGAAAPARANSPPLGWLGLAGGLVSGFLGGLSGHQGALRTACLSRMMLRKEAFIGTGVVIACLVDLSRLSLYATHLEHERMRAEWILVTAAAAAGLVGAVAGARLLKKVQLPTVKRLVAAALCVFGIAMMAGLV